MKKLINRYGKVALSLIVALAVFLHWRIGYPCALSFQEQFQLFLFDDDYLLSRLAEPGGAARYVGEFLVQFYNNVTLGALIITLTFLLVQRLTWRLMRRVTTGLPARWYVVSFLPMAVLWYLMGDQNVMMSFTIAYLLALVAMLLFLWVDKRFKGVVPGMLLMFVGTPVFYWLAGSTLWMVVAFAVCYRLFFRRQWGRAPFVVLYAVACILFSQWLVAFPLNVLLRGIDYYRFPNIVPYVMFFLLLLSAVLPFIVSSLSRKASKSVALVADIIAALAFVAVPFGFDAKTYELMDYDYLVRTHQWEKILQKAEKQRPDLPMSISATNLALGMTGQLGDRAFSYPQHGVEGLLPPFQREFSSQLITSEVYYQLGLVNTAERFAFEAMEALPDYNKSGRVMKRLAQVEIINGEYAVARRYLEVLKKTLFYGQWAQRTEALLGDDQAVNQHPDYGRLRRYRLTNDFLFSEQEVDKMFGQLYQKDPQNQLAMQYLLLYPLLERNMQKFMQYVGIVEQQQQYMPTMVQEGIAFAYLQSHQQLPKNALSPMVMQRFSDFAHAYTSGRGDASQLEPFRNTVWYYLSVGNN